jgi:tripartite-type tricarboxylate transporter receptor subunit TctC
MQTLKSHRAAALVVLLALVSAAVTCAWSQTYPARPVKLVTQGAAGSGSDVVARLVTDQLSRMWDQQIVILNHPGAGGSTAARVAAAAPPDGYTLYVAATSTFIAIHEMFPNLPFSIDRDFTPIGLMGELPMMLAVSPSLGVKTLAELIALSKTRPVLYAGNARGTFANLTVERLRQELHLRSLSWPRCRAAGPPRGAHLDDVRGAQCIPRRRSSGIGQAAGRRLAEAAAEFPRCADDR